MKKILCLLGILTLFAVCPANAMYENAATNAIKADFQKLDNIGMNLLEKNKINKRFTFNFTAIDNQHAFPILLDTSNTKNMNLHNNREILVYYNDFMRASSDDEIAALLAFDIARGLESYKGILNGQLYWTKYGRLNEPRWDKDAVDIMVKAGYNPIALITVLDKMRPEWRGVAWSRHEKIQLRMGMIDAYIYNQYPEKTKNNPLMNTSHYKRFARNAGLSEL